MKTLPLFVLTALCLGLGACKKTETPSHEQSADSRALTHSPNATDAAMNTPAQRIQPDANALKRAHEAAKDFTPGKLASDLQLSLWASDLLVADPIAIDIDEQGRVYFTRTHRQKHSEFDIRDHRDWEVGSLLLTSVEEKRKFLHEVLAPELSARNNWLRDLNNDGSHDWRDLRLEKEQVYRLEDSDGDGLADTSLLVAEDFHDEVTDVAGALLVEDGEMFVGVGPDMWRLQDSNTDGVMDRKLSMAHGFGIHIGYSGHGMSGAEMGPDGRIYWGIGDIGFHGKGNDPEGKIYNYSDRGVVVRSNPDGTDFEVFAMGVRNTHEFAFDAWGNLISVDNDGDHPGESERIVYLTEGSDSGWRINWQFGKYRDPVNNNYKVWMDEGMYVPFFHGQPAHITPAIANYVNGPTGMVYNPGTALSEKWQNSFFVVEFIGDPTRSGVHAFNLEPKGAGFSLANTEQVLGGVLATGLEFGNDGALYVADWVEGWKTNNAGRIWKLDTLEEKNREPVAAILQTDFSKLDAQTLTTHLEHQDMRVRQKAQFALVKNIPDAAGVFSQTLKDSTQQFARIHAIWGLSQLARKDSAHAELLLPYLQDKDPEIRAQAARWLGDLRYKNAAQNIVPLLEDNYPRARFFAAEALGRMAHAEAVAQVITMLRHNNGEDRFLHHAGSLALARMQNASALAQLANDDNEAVRLAAVVALRRMGDAGVAIFLNDSSDWVVAETARAIHDDASIPEALDELGTFLNTYSGNSEAVLRRAISANLRLATEKSLQNLLSFISNESALTAMREEAIAALSTWEQPSIFDRVDGKYRGHLERDASLVRERSRDQLMNLLEHSQMALRETSAKALGNLQIVSARAALLTAMQKDVTPQVRVAALQAITQLPNTQLADVLTLALEDQSSTVRASALDLLDKSNLDAAFIASLLSNVMNKGEHGEKQAAFTTLARLDIQHSRPVFNQALEQLANRSLSEEIVLDLVEAVKKTADQELNSTLNSALDSWAQSPLQKQFPGLLAGGDPEAGHRLFFWSQSASCLKCHSLKAEEVKAGPNLGNIASVLSKEEILQALVEPSARIAPGFGQQPSSMPSMSYFLTDREIRDIVSYLHTLK